MPRLNTALQNAVENKVIQVYELVYADIGSGDLAITNAPFNITVSGHPTVRNDTYIGVGQFLGFSEIREENKLTISEITATLSGIPAYDDNDNSVISDILNYDYIDKPVEVARAFFDNDVYLDSVVIFRGRVSAPVIQDDPGDTTTVAITASNNWIDYERTNGMVTNDNRHQALYTNDLGFEYAKDVIKDLVWKP